MNVGRGAVLLGGVTGPYLHDRAELVDRTGRRFAPEPLATTVLVGRAVLPDGRPLFPAAASVAQVAAEMADQRDVTRLRMRPGPELGTELAELDPGELGEQSLVEAIRAHSRMIAHHEAQLNRVVAELASRPIYGRCSDTDSGHEHDARRVAASEVSLALSCTPGYADARVAHAVRLVQTLPATLAALEEGRIDTYRARVIDEETAVLDNPQVVRAVEAAALASAEGKTGPALRAFVKRKVIAAAPETAEKRRKKARTARRVDKPFPECECDGMGSMELFGPIEDLAALFTAIDAAARTRRDTATTTDSESGQHPDTGIGLPALRFDVLADLAYTALAAGHVGCCHPDCAGTSQRLGTRHRRPATVNVTMPFTTLAGLDDQPGELAGYGPITAETARRLAADATLRRLLTDPATGALLDHGTTRYVPPQHLADHIIARDVSCRFPTCNRPAETCQLDHTIPHRPDGSGGPTSDRNLGPFHDRHHNDKTHHGFMVTQPEPGTFVINTPAGMTYYVDPEIIGPINHPPDLHDEELHTSRPRDTKPPPF